MEITLAKYRSKVDYVLPFYFASNNRKTIEIDWLGVVETKKQK